MQTYGIMTLLGSPELQNPDILGDRSLVYFVEQAADLAEFLKSVHPQIRRCMDVIRKEFGCDVYTRQTAFYLQDSFDFFEQIDDVELDERVFNSHRIYMNIVFSCEGTEYFIGPDPKTVEATAC